MWHWTTLPSQSFFASTYLSIFLPFQPIFILCYSSPLFFTFYFYLYSREGIDYQPGDAEYLEDDEEDEEDEENVRNALEELRLQQEKESAEIAQALQVSENIFISHVFFFYFFSISSSFFFIFLCCFADMILSSYFFSKDQGVS